MPDINSKMVVYHKTQADKEMNDKVRESNLESAARTFIENSIYCKGSGDNIYIQTPGAEKQNIGAVSLWLDKLDENDDGVITAEEVEKGGGDKYNILHLQSDEKVQKEIGHKMDVNSVMGGMKQLDYGLKNCPGIAWKTVSNKVVNQFSKEKVKEMFVLKEVKDYYDKNVWGMSEDSEKDNARQRERTRDLIQKYGFNEQELSEMNFTSEQIEFFIK